LSSELQPARAPRARAATTTTLTAEVRIGAML
jgi:hypothetical protein